MEITKSELKDMITEAVHQALRESESDYPHPEHFPKNEKEFDKMYADSVKNVLEYEQCDEDVFYDACEYGSWDEQLIWDEYLAAKNASRSGSFSLEDFIDNIYDRMGDDLDAVLDEDED